MSRQDFTGDVPAPSSSRVIRRIKPNAPANGEEPAGAQARPISPSEPAAPTPVSRPSVIRRIGQPPPNRNNAAPPQATSGVSHPVIKRLPALPTPEEAARRRTVPRPLEPEHPRSLPQYDEEASEQELLRNEFLICGQCGSTNRSKAMFCSTCGGALPAVRGLPRSLQRETEQLHQADHERELEMGGRQASARRVIWRGASLSHPGRIRENNEDSLLIEQFPGNGWLMIVADGMGGAEAGEVASGVAATLVRELVETRIALDSSPQTDRRPWIAEAVEQANLLLYRHAEEDPALHGMGTTLVVAIVQGYVLELGNVGDSRAYMLHPNGKLEQLTVDHSIVAHLVRMGLVAPDEADAHPLRSQLYRVVASASNIEVDTTIYELEPGSKLMLCSDGLPLHVTDDEIAEMMRKSDAPEDVCNGLVALALARGGEDNVSVISLMPG